MNKKLNTKATDNHGYTYDVEIQDRDGKPVLRILGTPGGWYYETVAKNDGPIISIDFGAGWNCTNFDDVLAEARVLVEATLTDGAFRWNKSGNIVPTDILEESGVSFDRDAHAAALDIELDELRANMVEAEKNMTDEQRAERDFEMRAAFGPGETVVNVFTGQEFKT